MVLYQPPKGHVDNEKTPNYPQVDYRKRPLPTGVFFLCEAGIARRGTILAHGSALRPDVNFKQPR